MYQFDDFLLTALKGLLVQGSRGNNQLLMNVLPVSGLLNRLPLLKVLQCLEREREEERGSLGQELELELEEGRRRWTGGRGHWLVSP